MRFLYSICDLNAKAAGRTLRVRFPAPSPATCWHNGIGLGRNLEEMVCLRFLRLLLHIPGETQPLVRCAGRGGSLYSACRTKATVQAHAMSCQNLAPAHPRSQAPQIIQMQLASAPAKTFCSFNVLGVRRLPAGRAEPASRGDRRSGRRAGMWLA